MEGAVTQRGNTVQTEKGKEPENVPDQQDPVAGRGAEGGDSAGVESTPGDMKSDS